MTLPGTLPKVTPVEGVTGLARSWFVSFGASSQSQLQSPVWLSDLDTRGHTGTKSTKGQGMASTHTSLDLDQLATLKPADRAAVVAQLRALLTELPPDPEINKDRTLRDLLTVFLAGYELGRSQGHAESEGTFLLES